MRTREVNLHSHHDEAKNHTRNPFEERTGEEQDMPSIERQQAKPANPFSDFEVDADKPQTLDTSNAELPETRTTRRDLGPEWVRQDVLSLYVPYEFSELYVRPLTLPLLSKMSLAMRTKSLTILADVIGQCLTEDVRELTPSDFYFLLYWIRDNSFTKTPITITWTSRYNNENELRFKRSDLKFHELEMTKEQYAVYQEYGLCFPTVRDMELIRNDQTAPADEWMLDYAQYAYYKPENGDYTDYAAQKVKALEAIIEKHGLEDVILKINEFSEKIYHGVTDTVEAVDKHFDPEKAATFFESVASACFEAAQALQNRGEADEIASLNMFRNANAYLTEAAEIRGALEAGEPVLPKKEVVAIRIEATDFFPGLR